MLSKKQIEEQLKIIAENGRESGLSPEDIAESQEKFLRQRQTPLSASERIANLYNLGWLYSPPILYTSRDIFKTPVATQAPQTNTETGDTEKARDALINSSRSFRDPFI
jgi:hypothetical protein